MKKFGNHWVPDADARGRRNRQKLERMYVLEDGSAKPLHIALDAIRSDRSAPQMSERIAIDAGANVGSYTRLLAETYSRVYSFEPSPDTFACLERNVYEWGHYPKVRLYNAAVGDVRSYVSMGRSFGRLSITSRVKGSGSIPAIPLDSLGLQNVGFLKLDVEGFELKALIGATHLLRESRPYVFMEVKPAEEEVSDNPYAAENHLLALGYEMMLEAGINRLFRPGT